MSDQPLNKFGEQTFSSPHEAFLASQLSNCGVPWPRKPIGGKPQLTKVGKSARTSRSSKTVHAKSGFYRKHKTA